MGAGRFVRQAARGERATGGKGEGMPSEGITRYDRCSCHPAAWGLKKGLKRGRRRRAKIVIREALRDG